MLKTSKTKNKTKKKKKAKDQVIGIRKSNTHINLDFVTEGTISKKQA